MTQEEYKAAQRNNIDRALKEGKEFLRVSASLHEVCDTADTSETRNDGTKNYYRDTLMYFDFNDAVTDIAGMPGALNDFIQQVVDIKIENDRRLLSGDYIFELDNIIARFFEMHDLRGVKVVDETVLSAVRDALQMLEELKNTVN